MGEGGKERWKNKGKGEGEKEEGEKEVTVAQTGYCCTSVIVRLLKFKFYHGGHPFRGPSYFKQLRSS